ncbi:MAG: quinolinate synthase NadA [Myxococcota bacterium]|nr:quinolinate synthase NadA [Myxococcota bacterium]
MADSRIPDPVTTEPDLAFTPEVERAVSSIYERLSHVIPAMEWPVFAPYVKAINELKREKNAVILAHNYMTPEIFHGVADIVGDSLALAKEASDTDADIIVLAGVHFMAETAKILNPEKKVLIPDFRAGCSLAESMTGEDVRSLKEAFPGVPVVSYVNTPADVKAETDVCCTSSNALHVVESLGVDRVLLLPDEYLAQNVASQTEVEILAWRGRCEVHERFSAQEIRSYRSDDPGLIVLAHPECPPEVVQESDFAGSTSGMIQYVREKRPARVVMLTECSMSDNVAAELPDVDFVRPCNLCPHMKRITLPGILDALLHEKEEVTVPFEIAKKARRSVERMLDVGLPPDGRSAWKTTGGGQSVALVGGHVRKSA